MKCSKCGAEIRDGFEFCPVCGAKVEQEFIDAEFEDKPIEEPVENYEEPKEQPDEHQEDEDEASKPVWKVFAIVGFVCGIVAIATCWCFGGFTGIPGIIFSKMGMKTNDPDKYEKARLGFKRSLAGLIITGVLFILLYVIIFAAALLES